MKAKTSHKSESRRIEAKRKRSQQRGSVWRRLTDRVSLPALAIGVAFCAATLVIQFWGTESMPWQRDERVEQNITARVDFKFEDSVRKEQLCQSARDSAPNVYERNEAAITLVRQHLMRLRELAVECGEDASKLREEAAKLKCPLDDAAGHELLQHAGDEKPTPYETLVNDLVGRLRDKYIVEAPEDPNRKSLPPPTSQMGPDAPREVPSSERHSISDRPAVRAAVTQAVADTKGWPDPLRGPLGEMIAGLLSSPSGGDKPMPLWIYSPEATARAMAAAAGSVDPKEYTVTLTRGTVLVKEDTELTTAELDLLRHEHQQYLVAEKTDPVLRTRKLLHELGLAIVVILVTCGLGVYTASYQGRVFQNPARALGLAGLMLVAILMARINERIEYLSDSWLEFAVFFVVVASALLSIAYDQRFAFGVGGALAVLVTLASRADFGLFLTLMAAMGVTVFALNDIRTRSKLVAVGGMAAVAAGVTSLATGMIVGEGFKFIYLHAAVAAAMALFAGFFVQGILHYFERLFGVATSMTLLEWSDAGQPLLRRLAQEAPGTYSHSVVLSQMAEDACEVIGARGLLARVGALYHDVGKMQKPAYFVENQEARMNRHDGLSPTMSLLIIVGHVKDGIETARAYNLPRVLHGFIAEHHGTTMVKYFHHMASEAAAKNSKTKGRHDREVPDTEFRYPGPKPQSRESAILMLCDSCEGAVRAQSEPTLGRIESTVHQVTMDRLNDGQFDDCDITLRELKLVEQSLVKSLAAIHHGRIKYPKGAGEREEEAGKGKAGEADATPADEQADQPAPEVAHQA